jgi:hypothetical protein
VSVTVQTVSTSVPGSLGFLPDDHGIQSLLRFEETDASLAPVDDLGALSAVRPVGTFPAVVDGYTSRARELDGLSAIQATDALGTLILDRAVSIVALVEWDHAATAGPDALLAHGVGGSAEERRSWHLRLGKPGGGIGRVQWVWEDRAGAEHAQGGGDFFLPAGGFMMVAATREWCGDRFLLRYWVGEQLLAELETTDMEVGGGIGATVTIGCVGDGLGGFDEYFHGRIDQVAVLGAALTQAQVTHLWQRIAVWPQDLYAALRDLQPVGEARTRDPASLVQRRIRTQSGVLAATSALLQLRADAGLPDRAYGPRLELWERATGQRAHASDSVAARQARVLAALRGEQGLTAAALRQNLAPLYGCDPEDFEILRFDNIARGIDYAAWAEAGDGAVLIDPPNDTVTLRVAAGAQYGLALGGYSYRTAALTESLVTCTVESTSLSNDDLFVGFATHAEVTLAGLRLDTSAGQIVNTLSGANVQAYTLPLELIVFLDEGLVKARINGGAAMSLGAAPSGLVHAAVSLRPISAAVPGSARSVTISGLFVQNLDSRQTQVGYFYKAQAVDLLGARQQLSRQQPAHAFAAALTTRALRCEDLVNGVEQAPLVETALNALRAMLGEVSRAWAGSAVDLVAGELLVAAGTAGVDASVPSAGLFGDQALVLAAGTTDKWTLPSAAALNFTAAKTTALILVYNIDTLTPGTEYTLIGNREGGSLNGFEIAITTSGDLVVRFDPGAGAMTEITLLSANALTDFWHTIVVKHDPGAALVTVATELQVVTGSFAGSAASSTPAALGAYRALPTPAWRCPLLAVLEEAAAEALDPVATAKYVLRCYPSYPHHVTQLARLLREGVLPDFCWAGSSIDEVALEPTERTGTANIVQVPLTNLAGPFALAVSGAQSWVASDPSVGQLHTDSSALIVVCADLVSFTAATNEDFCGTRTVVLNAGWQLFISGTGVPALALDDNTGGAVSSGLTGASSTIGKHVYLIRWIASTQQVTFVSEVDSTTLNFAGRSPVNTAAFRIGKTRADLNGVNWIALNVAFLYTNAFETLSAAQLVALAAALKSQL